MKFDVEVDIVVDDVFAEEGEQSSGAVVAAELGAVELELCLTGEMICVCSGNDGGKAQGLCDATQGHAAMQGVVWCAGCTGWERICAVADELGCREAIHGEEVVVAQVADEHGVVGGVHEVFTGDGVHVEGEAGGLKDAVLNFDVAAGELERALMMIEEIAARPADDAGFGVEFVVAVGC
ncbi:MAG: hypothetical protein B7Z37_11850 [Verrucomicrobia bacterium 12-59-8]|nr:MAG: hypothetical protein B7Z37_11850 [Verrucomicrobia bacterium 12-59-8]